MNPGEFVGADGTRFGLEIWMRHGDVGARINPYAPDFALAVAALQSLIRPSLDPRSGRVMAMREAMSEQWAYVSGVTWTWQS